MELRNNTTESHVGNNDTNPTNAIPTLSWWGGVECSWDHESYAGGSVATGRATQAGQVEG
jgi:hypothetical protein